MSQNSKPCFPRCDFFRCGQKALIVKEGKEYCRWAEDECTGGTCNYAICVRARLLPGGVCGLNIKRRTNEEADFESLEEPRIKLKGKLLRKLRSEEIY